MVYAVWIMDRRVVLRRNPHEPHNWLRRIGKGRRDFGRYINKEGYELFRMMEKTNTLAETDVRVLADKFPRSFP